MTDGMDGTPEEQMGRTNVIMDGSEGMEQDQERAISPIRVGSNPKVNKFLKVT